MRYKQTDYRNGLECVKAKMKLSVLQDNQHTDEDKKKRLNQIDHPSDGGNYET